jgi:hypothetical protein
MTIFHSVSDHIRAVTRRNGARLNIYIYESLHLKIT